MSGQAGGRRRRRAARPERDVLRGIDEEVRFHIEGRAEALMAAGVPEAEARRRALEAFGDVERVRLQMSRIELDRARRDRWRGYGNGLWADVRVGARRLLRARMLTMAAIVTLALGIGASVAVFSVVDRVVLRPLPYADADRLVELTAGRHGMNIALSRELSGAMPSVESFSGVSRWGLTLTGEGVATTLAAEVVDAGYFDVFRVQPLLGRVFTAAETEPATSDVVLLSHALWQQRFGGDRSVLGRRLRLDGYAHESMEIIGVMPPGFRSTAALSRGQSPDPADAWIPLQLAAGRTAETDSSWYVNPLLARVRPGVSIEQVTLEVQRAVRLLRERHPGLLTEQHEHAATAYPLIDYVLGGVRRPLWLLLGAVALLLLIGCANLANLQLARAAGRRRDLALRAALGAPRLRLVREQLIEAGLLSLLGAGVGVFVAMFALRALDVAHASGLPRVAGITIDWRGFVFALLVSGACVLLFGLIPALRASRVAPREDLQAGGRGASAGRAAHRASRALVMCELALSVVLVSGAGLVLASFTKLRAVDPGLDVRDVLMVRLMPSVRRYHDETAIQLYRELEPRITALPGVTGVGAIQVEPFAGGNWSFPYLAEGQTPRAGTPLPSANFRVVTPGYFQAVDMALLAGRGFDESDRAGAPRAIVLNESFARDLWPDQDPLGRELRVFGSMSFRVVGIVGDVRQHALDREPRPEMYVAQAQWSLASMALMVEAPRAARLAPAIRDAVHELDSDIPVQEIRPLADVLGESLAQRRFFASLLTAFGVLALVLGGVGVYGVMSHMVSTTLRDAGVRLALGASPSAVLRRLLWRGLTPAVAGVIIGLVAAAAATRLLRGLLFDMEPVDARVYSAVVIVLGAVALVATWLPARRAARLDPLTVLRGD